MLLADPVESSEKGPPRLLLPSSPALKMLSGSLSAAPWVKTSGGYQPVHFASMCPLEVKRDCRMAGQACPEGVVLLSVRAWARWGALKNQPAIIRCQLPLEENLLDSYSVDSE